MKLRIQDNSIRFRISLKERKNSIRRVRSWRKRYSIIQRHLKSCIFQYGIRKSSADPSECVIQPGSIILQLDDQDCKTLNNPSQEGVYLQKKYNSWMGHSIASWLCGKTVPPPNATSRKNGSIRKNRDRDRLLSDQESQAINSPCVRGWMKVVG